MRDDGWRGVLKSDGPRMDLDEVSSKRVGGDDGGILRMINF